jgi:hypothetical protein
MNKLSKEAFNRMDGLTNLKAMEKFNNAIITIGKDLYADGFEVADIIEYFKIMVGIAASHID